MRMSELIFGIKKSRINEVIHKRNKIQNVVGDTYEATTPLRNRTVFIRIGFVSWHVDGLQVAALDEVEWYK
ncbi:MAG: hypothetical protein EZS28_035350 [Streblomastix strix]|uniref:Uncharacterized protein n=1 Tax=Streblomastix strix TaxID=222440 RepID=A0A5J4UG02_9EUKA|nr:MAG: hypothetical protein EZS28_035350 [Streblomastix strix]